MLHTADDGRTMRELLRTEGPEQAVQAVVAVVAATFARSGLSSPA